MEGGAIELLDQSVSISIVRPGTVIARALHMAWPSRRVKLDRTNRHGLLLARNEQLPPLSQSRKIT
jgi:hypothetical protein